MQGRKDAGEERDWLGVPIPLRPSRAHTLTHWLDVHTLVPPSGFQENRVICASKARKAKTIFQMAMLDNEISLLFLRFPAQTGRAVTSVARAAKRILLAQLVYSFSRSAPSP